MQKHSLMTLLNLNQEGISLVDDTSQRLAAEYLMMFKVCRNLWSS